MFTEKSEECPKVRKVNVDILSNPNIQSVLLNEAERSQSLGSDLGQSFS